MATLMHVIPISLCLAPANNDPIAYSNFTQTVHTGSNYSRRLKAGTTPARSKFKVHIKSKRYLLLNLCKPCLLSFGEQGFFVAHPLE